MKFKLNYWIVLLSILLAFMFWVREALLKEQETVVQFSLVVKNDQSNIVRLHNVPSHIKFRVRGLGYEILKLKFNKPNVLIDAQTLSHQPLNLSIADYKFNIPSSINVEVLGLVSEIDLKAPKKITTLIQLPIQIDFADDDARNLFYQRSFRLADEQVSIKTQNDIPMTIRYIKTQRVNSDLLQKDKIKLKLISPSLNISLSSQYVEVYRSTNELITKVIPNVQIQNEPNFKFFPQYVSMRIRGQVDAIGNVTPVNVRVNVIISERVGNQFPLKINLPKGIELIDYSPHQVQISESK